MAAMPNALTSSLLGFQPVISESDWYASCAPTN